MKKIKILLSASALSLSFFAAHAQWSVSGTNIYNNNSGNVGIGTSSPSSKLHVNGGILSTGSGSTPVSGAGSRFMWVPGKYALRAGSVSGTHWDDANIGVGSVALGLDNKASGYTSFAHGYNSTAQGGYSFAFGFTAMASGSQSIAMGQNSTASTGGAIAIGANAQSSGLVSVALGSSAKATGDGAFSAGLAPQASGSGSTATGNQTIAQGDNSFATGYKTQATGYASATTGDNTIASGSYSFATGLQSQATGHYSFATGNNGKAGGYAAVAMGGAHATADHSVALGTAAVASGLGSSAFGLWTNAQGQYSKAFGHYVTAQNDYSMVIGSGALAYGDYLVNTITNSLMIGFNSNLPTVFVGPASGPDTFGFVGIGTTAPQSELAVNGTITAQALNLTMIGWPDYVFGSNYQMRTLQETEQYIKTHQHLPGVPSAKEIEEKGLDVGAMNKIMMEKIEELTLHLIDLEKENKEMKKDNAELRRAVNDLKHNRHE